AAARARAAGARAAARGARSAAGARAHGAHARVPAGAAVGGGAVEVHARAAADRLPRGAGARALDAPLPGLSQRPAAAAVALVGVGVDAAPVAHRAGAGQERDLRLDERAVGLDELEARAVVLVLGEHHVVDDAVNIVGGATISRAA